MKKQAYIHPFIQSEKNTVSYICTQSHTLTPSQTYTQTYTHKHTKSNKVTYLTITKTYKLT